MTMDDLNRASDADFIALLGSIYEHSPWIAARAVGSRPFADVDALQAAMAEVVAQATNDEHLTLIKAHPDLGGQLARAGQLAPSSADEQASLGLDALSDTEFEIFYELNNRYRARFTFPFVIAVRQHTRNSVLAAFRERLQNDATTERRAALAEINMIARLRLDALIAG
jgi:2-oxo-4-hydroxy-4-carboxy-5-ureidoimidazoline decarboxylase